jgi:hypothetical protein
MGETMKALLYVQFILTAVGLLLAGATIGLLIHG